MFVKKIMKTTINLFTSIALLLATMNSTAQNRVSIDNETSTLNWTGKKVLGEHTGTIKLANSYIVLDEKGVKNGEINIEMSSLTNTDMEGEWSDKLVEHLKSADFFDTQNHPNATFKLNKVIHQSESLHLASGILTIKGISNPLSFPIQIKNTDSVMEISGLAEVDRTLYDVKYGSASFFDSLGDKAINNLFELNFELKIKIK